MTPNRKTLLALFILAIHALIIYSNSFFGEFIFDDIAFIKENPYLFNWSKFFWLWKEFSPSRYLTFLTFSINYHIHEFNPFGYHLTNFCIHLANGYLVYFLIKQLLQIIDNGKRRDTSYPQTDATILAFFTALIFLTHPVQTQAVTYIHQRLASLAALFYLLSINIFLKIRRQQTEGAKVPRKDYILLALSLCGGLFSKETFVTIPVILLLIEIFFITDARTTLKNKYFRALFIPGLTVIVLLPLVLIFLATQHNMFDAIISQSFYGDVVTISNHILTQFRVLVHYWYLLFYPVNQIFDYHYAVSQSFFEIDTFTCFLIHALIIYMAVRLYRTNRLLSFAIFWFYITLSVESTLLPIRNLVWEHRLYLPMVGFAILTTFFIFKIHRNQKYAIFILSIYILFFSFLTFQRNKVWQNSIVFWQDNIKKTPLKARPYTNLGIAYLQQNDLEKAYANLSAGLALEPENFIALSSMGIVHQEQGDIKKAIAYFQKAIDIEPNYLTLNNLGVLFARQEDYNQAESYFQQAITIARSAEPHQNLAEIYWINGAQDKAVDLLKQTHQDYPYDLKTIKQLAFYYLKSNKKDMALKLAEEQIKKGNISSQDYIEMGKFFAEQGEFNAALSLYEKAAIVSPNYIETYLTTAELLIKLHQFESANTLLRAAQKISPNDQRLKNMLDEVQRLIYP